MIFRNKYNLPEKLHKKLILSSVLFWLSIILSVIVLANLRDERQIVVFDYYRGIDIVFAVDISRSMDVCDLDNNISRLEKGIIIAKESAVSVSGARFAAATGRDRGYLSVPLTFNNEAVLNFLEVLDGSSMTGRSTNLESLIDAAANAFNIASPARKVIVLISDGESHSGILRNALNRCVREGIIITAVAIGSDEGAPVPGLLIPGAQAPAPVSRRDVVTMRTAADRTGGIYIDGNRDNAASMLSTHLLSLEHESSPVSSRSKSTQKRTLLIILAIITYGAGKFIPRLSLTKVQTVSILAVLFIFSSCSEGKLLIMEANYLISRSRYDDAVSPYQRALRHKDAAPYAEYGLGLTLHSLDENTEALNRYNNSQRLLGTLPKTEHRELRYRNYYNSGIIHFEEGDFILAYDSFKEALRIDPKNINAKRNLEISLLSISMETTGENRSEERTETTEVIFDYIKQH
jgi:Ca-activated chloride channel family protein